MSDGSSKALPAGWTFSKLPQVAQINPPLDRCVVADNVAVDFVPMRAVEEEGGGIARPEVSTYGKVKKGYTSFIPGDVIMAKITPCMENGKTCVVADLPHGVCFGSTEFHVVRAERGAEARWIAYFLLQHSTRHAAQRQMMGGVGQMRVTARFLEDLNLPVPPHAEQIRILDALDELLSDLDAGLKALEGVQAKLRQYQAAVLKAAVEGSLTDGWRQAHPHAEPASALVKRVLADRRRRWEEVRLKKYKDAGKEPPKNWQAKYFEPGAPEASKLPQLPESWCWTTVDQLAAPEPHSITDGPFGSNLMTSHYTDSGPRVVRLQNIGEMLFVDERAHINQTHFEALKRHSVKAGDIVVAALGEALPRACMVPESLGPAIVKADCVRFRTHPALVASALCGFLNSLPTRARMAQIVHGVGRPRLNLGEIKGIALPLAPAEEQEVIATEIEDQLSVVDHLEADLNTKLKSTAALRQSILKAAFEGKLVPQDPNDEPASEVLKRIAAERAERERLAKEAKWPTKPPRARKPKRGSNTKKTVIAGEPNGHFYDR